jgi:hypothetical protein
MPELHPSVIPALRPTGEADEPPHCWSSARRDARGRGHRYLPSEARANEQSALGQSTKPTLFEEEIFGDRRPLGAWQTVIFRRDWQLFLWAVATGKPVLARCGVRAG